jgi:hypothetical protein
MVTALEEPFIRLCGGATPTFTSTAGSLFFSFFDAHVERRMSRGS